MTKKALITIALGCCTTGLMFTACDGGKEEQQSTQSQAKVSVFPLIIQQVSEKGEWFSYLRGINSTSIRPRVSGFLAAQEYENGRMVKEGDILFRIDPEMFEAELAQAQANLLASEADYQAAIATLEQARLDVARYEKLFKQNAVSEKDLTDARHTLRATEASIDACKASIEQAKAAINNAQINLDYTIVRAPFSGVVGTATASQGDLVSPSTELANIASIEPIRVDFAINADLLMRQFREQGNKLDGNKNGPDLEIVLEDGSVYPSPGKIVSMDSKVDESGLVTLLGHIPNEEGILRPGLPVRVRIPLNTYDAMLVPKDAIRTAMRTSYILIADKENKPRKVPVTVKGEYEIEVKEADGFSSKQQLLAIAPVSKPLEAYFSEMGYDKPEGVPVICDKENGVLAAQISAANSRLSKDDAAKAQTIQTTPLSYRPVMSGAMAQQEQAQQSKIEQRRANASKPAKQLSIAEAPTLVKVAPLVRREVAINEEWYGNLRGEDEVEIRPRVSGFLLNQNFLNGTMVEKGDVLFTIDPAPFKAALDQMNANLMAAKASKEIAQAKLDMAQQDFERFDRLAKQSPGTISDKTLTDARTSVQRAQADILSAEASIAQAQAAVKQAEINLSYTTITAPFRGRAGVATPSVGDLVSADSQPLVTLSSVDPIRVDFNVSGKFALVGFSRFAEKKQATNPTEPIDFEIILDDNKPYSERGTIVSADNALSVSRGTLAVVGRVDNKDGVLRSGMPVRVKTALSVQKNAYLVPARAPMASGLQYVIFVAMPDGSPEAIPVELGSVIKIEVDGVVQPMQIIDIERSLIAPKILAQSKAPSLEAIILGGAQVKSWEELLLKQAQAPSIRALMEKSAGKPLPDELPQQSGVKDWSELFLRNSGVVDFRQFILNQANAKDELDLMAQGQGCTDFLDMYIKQTLLFEDFSKVPVITEGSMPAGMAMKSGGKVRTQPFVYNKPQPVVPSVTADSIKTPNEKSEQLNAQ